MLFQVSPTTFQVSSTCFQGVFLSCTCFFHQFSINCSNKFSSCSTFSQLFPAISPCGRAIFFPVPGGPGAGVVPIRPRGAGHRGAQRHGGGRRAGRAAGGGGSDHGAAGDGTHRLHLPQLGTGRWKHWSLVVVMGYDKRRLNGVMAIEIY